MSHNKDIPAEGVVITTKILQGNTLLKVWTTDIIKIKVNNIEYSLSRIFYICEKYREIKLEAWTDKVVPSEQTALCTVKDRDPQCWEIMLGTVYRIKWDFVFWQLDLLLDSNSISNSKLIQFLHSPDIINVTVMWSRMTRLHVCAFKLLTLHFYLLRCGYVPPPPTWLLGRFKCQIKSKLTCFPREGSFLQDYSIFLSHCEGVLI